MRDNKSWKACNALMLDCLVWGSGRGLITTVKFSKDGVKWKNRCFSTKDWQSGAHTISSCFSISILLFYSFCHFLYFPTLKTSKNFFLNDSTVEYHSYMLCWSLGCQLLGFVSDKKKQISIKHSMRLWINKLNRQRSQCTC